MPLLLFRSLNVYVRTVLLLPSVACELTNATCSQTLPPSLRCTENPLLSISAAVSHFNCTFVLLERLAVNDLNVTGKPPHWVDNTKSTCAAPSPPSIFRAVTTSRSILI